MYVFVTQGQHIIVIANSNETVPTQIVGLADLVVRGGEVVKSRWP